MSPLVILLAAIAAYVAVMMLIGLRAGGSAKSAMDDYALAGRTVGVFVLAATIAASLVNSLAVTGTPALFYRGGILYLQVFLVALGLPLFVYLFGPRIARNGARWGVVTQGEYFARFYDSRLVHGLVAVLGILAILPFVAVQLAGTGKILSGITDGAIGVETGAILCAATVAVYVCFGGARAVIWTDVVQGLIAFAFLGVSVYLFSRWVGGVAEGVDRAAQAIPDKLSLDGLASVRFLDFALSWPLAAFLLPHVFQRMFMARSPGRLRETAVVSFVVMTLVAVLILAAAVFATAELHGTLDDPDQLIVAMYARYWPMGGMLLAVVVFALSMSTIDSIALTAGSIVARDLLRGLLRIRLSETQEIATARLVTLLILVLSVTVALTGIGRGALIDWITLSASIATLTLWPLLGTVWSRGTREGCIAGMGVGLAVIILCRFTDIGLPEAHGFACTGFAAGGLAFVVVSLLTSPRPAAEGARLR